jgi:hypothetical protein
MNWIKAGLVTIVLSVSLSSAQAQSTSANFDLVSANWSAKQAQTLNALPKSAVWNFVSGPFRGGFGHVCDFRFADLRHSGSLSLIVVIDTGTTAGCDGVQIFDKTESGFEQYSTVAQAHDLRDSIQDINHDGNLELVLYGALAESEIQHLGCVPEWPLVFVWNGSTYADVSRQYETFYTKYLQSLNRQLAAVSPSVKEERAPILGRLEDSPTVVRAAQNSEIEAPGGGTMGGGFGFRGTAPAPAPSEAATPKPDYRCERIEVAKTDQFLGIRSEAIMSAAIKDSESATPDNRALAAIIFSIIGTPEAMQDLNTLANDSDPTVAKVAKARFSEGQDEPGDYGFDEAPVPKAFLPKQ